MTNPTAPTLDGTNAKTYQANPEFNKQAVLTWKPIGYKLDWGEQNFDGPHMIVDGDKEQPYGCALEEFFTTHKPAIGQENRWFKNVSVLAKQVDVETDIVTMVDGREESRSTIPAGHWIIRNPKGEQYYNDPQTFAERYLAASTD